MGFLDTINSINNMVGAVAGQGVLDDAIKDRKQSLRFCAVASIVIFLICIGIMYLRFRVWG